MLIQQVKKTIDRYHLLSKGDRVIVGVSAGVDSMVLLHILNACRQEYNLSLMVAHINHGLRPDESEKEEELVRKESERLALPFESGRFNVKEFQKIKKLSPQEAARRVRFYFYHHLFKKFNANKIALGHNADDQVETVLLKLLRGAGLKGLKGMLPIREQRIIRPLLEVWRKEIETFAKEMSIPFLSDSSNLKTNYLRNRIRWSLIPFIETEFQSNFKEVISKASRILREEDDYFEERTEEVYQKIVHEEKEGLSFESSAFQSLPDVIQRRLIQKLMGRIYRGREIMEEEERVDSTFIHKKLIQHSPSFRLEISNGFYLEKNYDWVFFKRGSLTPIPPFEIELAFPGSTFIEAIKRKIVIEKVQRGHFCGEGVFGESRNIALLDVKNLQFPLRVRNFRPGDRFQPLGAKGTQKLKEFFIDHKIPRFERPQIPLLLSDQLIAWVIGYRIDERFKITEKTQSMIRIEII